MRRYGHKCHFKIIIFYSTFSLSSQYLIQRFLSLLIVFSLSSQWSLSLSSSDHPPLPSNQQQSSRRSLIKSSHRSTYAIVQRYDDLTDQQYSIIRRLCLAFSLPSRHADLNHRSRHRRSRVCGFVPMDVDVDLGYGFVPISLVVHFFFFWGGVGGCGFVSVMAVDVVAAVVVGGRCCGNGSCAVVVVVDNDDEDERE